MIERRALGASGLTITPLVLGGNVFGFTADRAASFAVLDAFVDRGGTMIDTADVYSAWVPGHVGGESETMIGEWLRASGKRDQVLIATKVGMMPGGLKSDVIERAVEGSLKRLGTDRIDLYFAHKDDADTPLDDVLAAFARLLDAGKIRSIGASNYSAMRLKGALDASKAADLPHYTVLQPEYNLVSRHGFEGELQDLAITHNIGVVPYYGLASGFLTGKYRSRDDLGKSVRGDTVAKYLDGKGAAVLAEMDRIASETGATHAQIALAWLAAQDGVTAPIASATSVAQMEELMEFLEIDLTPDQLDRLTMAGV
jgi:aryl-alcohol dehydrogenase-like predicted oxidoreductase